MNFSVLKIYISLFMKGLYFWWWGRGSTFKAIPIHDKNSYFGIVPVYTKDH